jgi:undecaprenyl-diphosphatase
MFWVALILGLVEGLTEFLPVSSTGHLIVASRLLDFEGKRAEVFNIFIQLGAILAVVWEYRGKLTRIALDLPSRPRARGFVWNLGIAFLPAAIIGLLTHDFISARLFSPLTVALALIAGALLILLVEALPLSMRTTDTDSVSRTQALLIGILVKNFDALEPGDLYWLAVSFVISFLVAWASVRWLLRYVSTHTFRLFAWYRLAFGAVILLVLYRL